MDHVFARIKSFIGTFRVQHPSEQYYTYTMIAKLGTCVSSWHLCPYFAIFPAFFFSGGHLLNVARPALISISLYCRLGDAERRWVSCTDHGLMRLPRPHTSIPATRQDRRERKRERERGNNLPALESKTYLNTARGKGCWSRIYRD